MMGSTALSVVVLLIGWMLITFIMLVISIAFD
jgi:hypothetical protein